MPAILIVSYRTRLVEATLLRALTPEISAAANLRDEAKINADKAARYEAFLAAAPSLPYTGTFEQVLIVDMHKQDAKLFNCPPAGSNKPPVCVSVRDWILRNHPDAWSNAVLDKEPARAIFVGFNPRLFIKMMGLECSLPEVAKPLPLRMWYSNADHRDIGEAILPHDYKPLTLREALKRRRPVAVADAAKWDKYLSGWSGPGYDVEKDCWFVCELANQLGFLGSTTPASGPNNV